jgi:hypothetical protein
MSKGQNKKWSKKKNQVKVKAKKGLKKLAT